MTEASLQAVPDIEEAIVGAAEIVRTERGLEPHRLPAWVRAQCADPQLAMVEAQASSVRLSFRTEARHIELDLLRSRTTYAGVPPRADGRVDLMIDGERHAHAVTSGGRLVTIDMATGTSTVDDGPVFTARFDSLPSGMKDVELWLPHLENVAIVALRADAEVLPRSASARPLWVHHGSSISHGSNAAHPTGIWPAIAARLGGVELRNLGFGGSALLDPFMARTIRDAPADLISLKLGINVVNADLMRLRAFGPALHGFLDTVRDGHPTTPLLVMSPIFCEIHENTPGPGAFDLDALREGVMRFRATGDPAEVAQGKLTLSVIRSEIERVVAQRRDSDPHLHYLDGRELYSEADAADFPLPDALHPDTATHAFMGERFARLAFGERGPLARQAS